MPNSHDAPRLDEPRPISLANTIWTDRVGVHDALDDLDKVRAWVRGVGQRMTLTPPLSPSDDDGVGAATARRLTELRDAVRRLAAESTGDPRTLGQSVVPDRGSAVQIVNSACARGLVRPELTVQRGEVSRRYVWVGPSFAEAVIELLANETIELVCSPQWDCLRPCVAPGCAYYFVKEHFRQQWCSAVCGNRARVARHAQRHRVR